LAASDETQENNNIFCCLLLLLIAILVLASVSFRFLGSDAYIFNKEIEAIMMSQKIQKSDGNSDGSI